MQHRTKQPLAEQPAVGAGCAIAIALCGCAWLAMTVACCMRSAGALRPCWAGDDLGLLQALGCLLYYLMFSKLAVRPGGQAEDPEWRVQRVGHPAARLRAAAARAAGHLPCQTPRCGPCSQSDRACVPCTPLQRAAATADLAERRRSCEAAPDTWSAQRLPGSPAGPAAGRTRTPRHPTPDVPNPLTANPVQTSPQCWRRRSVWLRSTGLRRRHPLGRHRASHPSQARQPPDKDSERCCVSDVHSHTSRTLHAPKQEGGSCRHSCRLSSRIWVASLG